MPLTLRRNPYPFGNHFAATHKKQQEPPTAEAEQNDDGLKLYPLTPEQNPKINRHHGNPYRGTRPVQPLHQQHMQQMRPTQHMPPMQQPIHQMPPIQHANLPASAPPTPPATPISPENAADQFRRINKGLPDGVHYEPLDKDTLRLLKDNGHIPTNEPATQPTTPTLPTPQIPHAPSLTTATPQPLPATHEIAKTIESLAQDERNAFVFYSNLARHAENKETAETLTALSADCAARLKQYLAILTKHFSNSFKPLETEIDIKLDFDKAVSLALSEENKALINLGHLQDKIADTPIETPLQRVVNKKIIAHQLLCSLLCAKPIQQS